MRLEFYCLDCVLYFIFNAFTKIRREVLPAIKIITYANDTCTRSVHISLDLTFVVDATSLLSSS